MKNLKTLVRLHKNNLDGILKQISALRRHQLSIEDQLANLLKEVAIESEKYASTEYGFVLDQYMVGARAKKELYQTNILRLDLEIQQAQIALREEYGELKKFEIALRNRVEEARDKLESEESKELDEIGIMRHEKSDAS